MDWIFTAYKTLDQVNTSAGVHTLVTYTADVVPIFIPLVLFAFFIIAVLGSYFASVRATGRGDFPASFAAGGFITALLATALSLIPNLITIKTLAPAYGIAIVGIFWLIFSRD